MIKDKSMGRKLIFLDIDGTLLPPGDMLIPESTLAALDRARANGHKLFLDHNITSIQDYIAPDTLARYDAVDINVYEANLFHTKMMLKEVDLQNYLFKTDVYELPPKTRLAIMNNLRKEMIEIFSGRNIY